MKGRVDADVAMEAARQAWGARELLLRLGFTPASIVIGLALPIGSTQHGKAVADRQLQCCVKLKMPGMPDFIIGCGPIPSPDLLHTAVKQTFARVASGEVAEKKLRAEFHATNAWAGREEIVANLRVAGHPASLTTLVDSEPN